MSELLKIHANGQWELIKAKPLDSAEMQAFKDRRESWLREKHGMKPAEAEDKKQPAKEVPGVNMRPAMGFRAQQEFKERVGGHKVKREPHVDEKGNPRAPKPHEHPEGKLVVPEGSHPADVKPEVRQGKAPKAGVIKRPRREEE